MAPGSIAVWAGRLPLIAFDLLRAGLLGLLLVVPVTQQALLLPLIAFGLGIGNSMFAIGLNSQLPHMIDKRAAAQDQRLDNLGVVRGDGRRESGGGVIGGGFGFETVFALNVATYLLAALLIVPLRFPRPDTQ